MYLRLDELCICYVSYLLPNLLAQPIERLFKILSASLSDLLIPECSYFAQCIWNKRIYVPNVFKIGITADIHQPSIHCYFPHSLTQIVTLPTSQVGKAFVPCIVSLSCNSSGESVCALYCVFVM